MGGVGWRWAAIAFCVLIGLYDVVYVIAFHLPDRAFANALPPFFTAPAEYPDFMVPYAVVRAYFEGKLSIVYDHVQLRGYVVQLLGLVTEPNFLNPPVWILMLLPLGLLVPHAAYAVFMTLTASAFAFESRRHPSIWLVTVTSPAAVWVVIAGQNSFLYLALIYGGLRLVRQSPALGGMMLGLLVYKPQICLLVPLALLASRQWRALIWMIGAGTALVVLSAVVFGTSIWFDYVGMTLRLADQRIDMWATRLSRIQISPFVAARILQFPDVFAHAVQYASTVVGATAVWLAFRYRSDHVLQVAVLVAATLIASPYGNNYDLILLMPAIAAVYQRGVRDGFYPAEPVIYGVLWLLPTAILLFNWRLPVTPAFVSFFGLYAALRLLREPPRKLSS